MNTEEIREQIIWFNEREIWAIDACLRSDEKGIDIANYSGHLEDALMWRGHAEAYEELLRLREALEQLCIDLNSAHNMIMDLQGCANPDQHDWPEYSSQANSIRWAEKLLGKKLDKQSALPLKEGKEECECWRYIKQDEEGQYCSKCKTRLRVKYKEG